MTRFTIVIPCFNAAATLAQTLESLMAQTLEDWQAIIVDDGSTDASREIVSVFAAVDPRISGAANPGKGPSAARNHGAADLATGEIVAFCDADDLWLPIKLAELDAAFADPDLDGAFAQIAFFRETPDDARVTSTVPTMPLSVPMLLGENPVCTMSNIALRRTAFLKTNGFSTDMVHNEDLEWLIRLVGGGARVIGLPSTQVFYRTSNGGLSADLTAMRRGRDAAMATARGFGFTPDRAAEAIHLRYLARRALRVGADRTTALRLCLDGLRQHPQSFLTPARRGVATTIGALIAPLLPRSLHRALFSR